MAKVDMSRTINNLHFNCIATYRSEATPKKDNAIQRNMSSADLIFYILDQRLLSTCVGAFSALLYCVHNIAGDALPISSSGNGSSNSTRVNIATEPNAGCGQVTNVIIQGGGGGVVGPQGERGRTGPTGPTGLSGPAGMRSCSFQHSSHS